MMTGLADRLEIIVLEWGATSSQFYDMIHLEVPDTKSNVTLLTCESIPPHDRDSRRVPKEMAAEPPGAETRTVRSTSRGECVTAFDATPCGMRFQFLLGPQDPPALGIVKQSLTWDASPGAHDLSGGVRIEKSGASTGKLRAAARSCRHETGGRSSLSIPAR